MAAGDDFDIYAEVLVEHSSNGPSYDELSQRVKERDAEVERLMAEVAQLRESNTTLKRNNEILCRNISSIFKTAQIELQRKNRMIEELRNELEGSSKSRSQRTGAPATRGQPSDSLVERQASAEPPAKRQRE